MDREAACEARFMALHVLSPTHELTAEHWVRLVHACVGPACRRFADQGRRLRGFRCECAPRSPFRAPTSGMKVRTGPVEGTGVGGSAPDPAATEERKSPGSHSAVYTEHNWRMLLKAWHPWCAEAQREGGSLEVVPRIRGQVMLQWSCDTGGPTAIQCPTYEAFTSESVPIAVARTQGSEPVCATAHAVLTAQRRLFLANRRAERKEHQAAQTAFAPIREAHTTRHSAGRLAATKADEDAWTRRMIWLARKKPTLVAR